MNVLIVEDDALTADSIASLLEQEGYQVRKAATAEQAEMILLSFRPDVVLADLVMPGAGTEVLMENMEVLPPVVVLTALPGYRPTFKAAAVLQKPQDPGVIVQTLKKVICGCSPTDR